MIQYFGYISVWLHIRCLNLVPIGCILINTVECRCSLMRPEPNAFVNSHAHIFPLVTYSSVHPPGTPSLRLPILSSSTLPNLPRVLPPLLTTLPLLRFNRILPLSSTNPSALPRLALMSHRPLHVPIPDTQLPIAPPRLIQERRFGGPSLISCARELPQVYLPLNIILEFREGRRFGAGIPEPLMPLGGYVDVGVVYAGIVLHYAARTSG